MWVGASQSDAHQPIRTSVSESKEAVYRPMRGASWDEEQTILGQRVGLMNTFSLELSYSIVGWGGLLGFV